MSCSSPNGKEFIKEWVDTHRYDLGIETIVDVGCGQGTYRKLLGNEYYWIGVEVWVPYVTEFHLLKQYDFVVVGDVRDAVLVNLKADLIILGDVLEHLEMEDALLVWDDAVTHFPHVIASIPESTLSHYSKVSGNPYDDHKSVWREEEVARLIEEDDGWIHQTFVTQEYKNPVHILIK